MNEKLCEESVRLSTFDKNWPIDFLDKKLLAQTGMFYTGDDDKVKCYFCTVEIGRWERNDNVLSEHIRWSPNCPLIRKRDTNNKPIDAESLNRILPPINFDVCGNNSDVIEIRPAAYAEASITESLPASESISKLNGQETRNSRKKNVVLTCKHPEYSTESARLMSYAEWPKQMKPKPAQLSEAGFFYTGYKDRVKCFSCGSGLTDWEVTDDPWEQHALWLGNCNYLKQMKGTNFIECIKEKFKNNTSISNKNIETKEDRLCKICYECEYDTIFIPCNHVVACHECSTSITKCPICRVKFKDVRRLLYQ